MSPTKVERAASAAISASSSSQISPLTAAQDVERARRVGTLELDG
ncbi:MAG: hypothetical protein ACXWNE_09980 [Candidatus Binataceae bacterium]